MRIDVVTIFPEYLGAARALAGRQGAQAGLLDLRVHDLRDWTTDRHRTVDDTPFGGGPGMVMRPDVWGAALDDVLAPAARSVGSRADARPASRFAQRTAERLAGAEQLVFACGRYEGIDARVAEHYRARGVPVTEISIGDYVLNGGEVAALVVVEAVARLLPGCWATRSRWSRSPTARPGCWSTRVYTRPPTWRGPGRARGAALRPPRADRAVAPRPGAAADRASGAPTCSAHARARDALDAAVRAVLERGATVGRRPDGAVTAATA